MSIEPASPTQPTHPRQKRILRMIADGIELDGMPPSIRGFAQAFKTSTSVVVYHLRVLELAGLIRRGEDGIPRALRLTSAGYAAIDRPSPADDAALGRAVREAAESGDASMAVLIEELAVSP